MWTIETISVRYPNLPAGDPKRAYPNRIEVPVRRSAFPCRRVPLRCLQTRRRICGILGENWLWSGPRTIDVYDA